MYVFTPMISVFAVKCIHTEYHVMEIVAYVDLHIVFCIVKARDILCCRESLKLLVSGISSKC